MTYVVSGVVLGALGIYKYIVAFGGAGATVPLTGFGYLRRVQHHKPNGDFGEVECGVIASPAYFARQGLPPCGACTAAGN